MEKDFEAAVEEGDGFLGGASKRGMKASVGAEDRSTGFAVTGGLEEIGESSIGVGGGGEA